MTLSHLAFVITFGLAAQLLLYPQTGGVRLSLEKREPLMDECVEAGLELRYRFEVQVCHRRTLWWDDCKGERVETSDLSYDPIAAEYRVVKDRWGDAEMPSVARYREREDAFLAARTTGVLDTRYLSHGKEEFLKSKSPYLSYRATAFCKEEGGIKEVLQKVSFGLLQGQRFDSGWIEASPNDYQKIMGS